MATKKLTSKDYWNNTYVNSKKTRYVPDYNSLDNQNNKSLINLIEKYSANKSVLEIGAGDSDFLIYLAKSNKVKFCRIRLFSIDVNLSTRAENLGVNVEIINEDLFCDQSKYFKNFGFVYSLGVEHFENLFEVLLKTKRYLKKDGIHYASIPNMSGIYGLVTKILDKELYEIHVPHDLDSFVKGHEQANMKILHASYQGYFSAGLLTSCKPFLDSGLSFLEFYLKPYL